MKTDKSHFISRLLSLLPSLLATSSFSFYFWGLLSGWIHISTSMSIYSSSLTSLVLTGSILPLMFFKLRVLFQKITDQAWFFLSAVIFLNLFCVVLFYNLSMDGFSVSQGSDGANHLIFVLDMLKGTDKYSFGMVYAQTGFVAGLKSLLDIDVFTGLRISFYLTLFIINLTCVLIFSIFWKFHANQEFRPGFVLVNFLASSAILAVSGYPIIHFLQVDGYYWQFYSLIPWCFILWLTFSEIKYAHTLIGLFAAALLIALTYSLNLADCFILICFFVLQRSKSRSQKFLWFLISFLLATLAFLPLLTIFWNPGWILKPDFSAFAVAILLLSLILWLFTRLIECKDEENQILRLFISLFIYWGVLNLFVFFSLPDPPYYAHKHILVPVVITSLVLSALFPIAISMHRKWFRERLWLLPVALIASVFFYWGMEDYYPNFFERYMWNKHFLHLNPLIDKDIKDRMTEILRKEKKPFALFAEHFWGESTFTNTYFGNTMSGLDYFSLPIRQPQGCFFWRGIDDGKPVLPFFGPRTGIIWDTLLKRTYFSRRKSCISYRPSWRKGIEKDINRLFCYACE